MATAKEHKPAPPKVDQIEITLAKDHIHQRAPYKAGAKIKIPETLLPWFRQQGLVKEA
jgi:hypothetical protein